MNYLTYCIALYNKISYLYFSIIFTLLSLYCNVYNFLNFFDVTFKIIISELYIFFKYTSSFIKIFCLFFNLLAFNSFKFKSFILPSLLNSGLLPILLSPWYE